MTSHSKIGRRRLVDEYIEIVFARFLHAKEEAGRQGDVKKGNRADEGGRDEEEGE